MIIQPLFYRTLAVFPLAFTAITVNAQDTLTTETDKISYMIGLEVGQSLQRIDTEFNLDAFMMGVKTVFDKESPLLSQEEVIELQNVLRAQMQAKSQAQAAVAGSENKTAGEAFLAENKTKEGVQTTDSGLQYKVIEEGDGPKPKATDTVTVHYRGTLIDGSEFDSSYSRGQPATFPLNGVIPGWTEGLQLMPVGSTYQFVIPSQLAYGSRGAGDRIGPNSTLIFEVELLSIQ